MTSVLKQNYFHDEAAAFEALEGIMWPGGKPPMCPHCGVPDKANRLAIQTSKASKKHPKGKPVYGLWKCYACRAQFTVRKGTIFEESRLELHLWFQAAFLMCSSKKGVSANQLHRTLGCTLKTAWFVAHRLRAAMDPMYNGPASPIGGEGKFVEADETYIGRKWDMPKKRGAGHKQTVLALVERGGDVRTFHIEQATKNSIVRIVDANVSKESHFRTDMAAHYRKRDFGFASHEMVDHSAEEYVRGDAYTNTLEGFFSLFKKGMKGIYQHCDEKHLHRYLAEFDFRYNNRVALGVNDQARTANALKGAKGKRLTYRRINEAVPF